MTDEVMVSPELKAMLAKCEPGQSKTMSVMASMGKDGKMMLSPANEKAEEKAEIKSKKKAGTRPKAVMDAIGDMY